MKHKLSSLLPALFLPLAVGGLAGYFTRSAMSGYKLLKKPPFAPPGWVFPVVWTILYLLMGYASWRIWKSSSPARWEALGEYVLTLALNFLWPLLFFLGGWWLAALLVLHCAVPAGGRPDPALCRHRLESCPGPGALSALAGGSRVSQSGDLSAQPLRKYVIFLYNILICINILPVSPKKPSKQA